MTTVIQFVPRTEANARENLADFIAAAHPLLASYTAVRSWEETPWDLRGVIAQSGKGRARLAVAFTSYDGVAQRTGQEMSEPFLSFAKAYFLYRQATRPTQAFVQLITALRSLEKALGENCAASDPCLLTAAICNKAAEHLKKFAAAYQMGKHVGEIADFLSSHRLVNPFQWKSPIPRRRDRNRVGKEADEARSKKLPTEAALDALPKCFNLATETRDLVITSVAALLCSAPDRISEVFSLPADCEVNGIYKGKPIYGLRWRPAKGAEPMVKWVVPTMVGVTRKAVSRLLEIGRLARKVAAWYEAHPTEVFLPEDLEHLRAREFIALSEVAGVLGIRNRISANKWTKTNRVSLCNSPVGSQPGMVRFADFERAVLAMLPPYFPIIDPRTGLKYSEALLVTRTNEIHSRHRTLLYMVESISSNQINQGLAAPIQRKWGRETV